MTRLVREARRARNIADRVNAEASVTPKPCVTM